MVQVQKAPDRPVGSRTPEKRVPPRSKGREGLVPNAGLVEAIEEGRTLKGRSTSAKELFDALEAEGQN